MTAGTADWVGQLIDKRYQVTKLLGEGGMGFVYVANDTRLGAKVVLKVPRPEMLADAEFRQRFVDEVRALVKLSHPNIVKVTDFGTHRETPFAVMQFLPGGSLDDRRPRDASDRPKAVAAGSLPSWLPAVADALDYIHAQGYIHRDIKPGNILFDAEKHAFISDFGVAKAAGGKQAQRQQNLTGIGNIIGTPEYLAPEVVLGQPFDGRIDQYALAVTVYELLSGGVPFQGNAPTATLVMHTRDTATPLNLVRPNVTPALASAVERAMAKNPAERFPSCTAFAQACLAGLSGKAGPAAATPPRAGTVRETLGSIQSSLATPANTPRALPRQRKSNRGLVLGLAAGGLLLVGGIATAVALSMKGGAAPQPPAPTAVAVPLPDLPPKPEPPKAIPPKPAATPAVTSLRVAPSALTIQVAGKPDTITVTPARSGPEAVTITVEPAGLTVTPLTAELPPGTPSARFTVSAPAGTPPGPRVVGFAAKTAAQATPFQSSASVAVRAPSFSVLPPAERAVQAGSADDIDLTLNRAGGYSGPVTFSVESSAVVDAASATVAADQVHGKLKLAVKESAPTGPATVEIKAEPAEPGVAASTARVRLQVVSFQKLAEFAGHDGAITALAFSPDARRILVGTATGSVYCRDLQQSEKPVWDAIKHAGPVHSVAFSSDGRLALSGGEDNTVQVWNAATGAVEVRLHNNEHTGGVWHVYFARKDSPLPTLLAKQQVKAAPTETPVSVSPNRSVYWDVKEKRPLEVHWVQNRLTGTKTNQRFLNVTAGMTREPGAQVEFGNGFALAGLEGDKLEVYQGKQLWASAPGNGGAIKAFAVDRSATRAATVGADRQLRLWEIAKYTAKLAPGFPRPLETTVRSLALSPDGTRLSYGGDDKGVRVYKCP